MINIDLTKIQKSDSRHITEYVGCRIPLPLKIELTEFSKENRVSVSVLLAELIRVFLRTQVPKNSDDVSDSSNNKRGD